jgi:hypothetical protein
MTEIEELRTRVEALEATQHAHVDTSHLSKEERDQILQELAKPARVFAVEEVAPIVVPTTRLHSYSIGPAKLLDELGKGHTLVSTEAASAETQPTGSLVERVANALYDVPLDSKVEARAAILAVAAAALQMHPDKNLTWERVALWLEMESNR